MSTDRPDAAPHREAASFGELVGALDHDALIAWLGSLMGPALRAELAAEDLWQETLALAWRDRESHEWRGLPAFRAWLRGIARNRLHDAVEWFGTQKRGGGRRRLELDELAGGAAGAALLRSSTPSRAAMRGERARAMQRALESLPEEYRDLVRACLFEEASVPEAAAALGVPLSTAYRRLLRGSELFRAGLQGHVEDDREGDREGGAMPQRR